MTAIRKIDTIPPLPNFNLPAPYKDDYWDFKNWDYYLNSSDKGKKQWNTTGNFKKPGIDFTICENQWIREEIKFYMYTKIVVNKVNLYTLSYDFQQLRAVIRFVNSELKNYHSLTELTDLSSYEKFLISKEKIPKQLKIEMGNYISSNLESTTQYYNSPYIKIMKRVISLILEFYDDRDELEKDIWNLEKIPFNINNSLSDPIRTLNFSAIKHKNIKAATKEYVCLRLNSLSVSTLQKTICAIKVISEWLDTYHKEITSLAQLTRPIIEEYIGWLNTHSGKNSRLIADYLGSLNTVMDYLRLKEKGPIPKYVPLAKIMDKNDYAVKVQYEPKPYSDKEMIAINRHLDSLENLQFARIVFLLQVTGCRVSEILTLKPEQLVKKNKKYSLKIHSTKTEVYHSIPIDETVADVIEQAIKVSKETYGEQAQYVFAQSIDDYFKLSSIRTAIRKMAYDNQLKDDSGKPLNITFQRFRTTVSCKYLELGIDANLLSLLLGHSQKNTLKHYAKVSDQNLKKAMQPRLDKFDMLIANIGNLKYSTPVVTEAEKLIPLPNGYCNKSIVTGICEHANSCLSCSMFQPDKRYLLGYKLQLKEVQQAIKYARENENDRVLDYNLDLEEKLINIISKMEEQTNE